MVQKRNLEAFTCTLTNPIVTDSCNWKISKLKKAFKVKKIDLENEAIDKKPTAEENQSEYIKILKAMKETIADRRMSYYNE